jgi:hypothetical protein
MILRSREKGGATVRQRLLRLCNRIYRPLYRPDFPGGEQGADGFIEMGGHPLPPGIRVTVGDRRSGIAVR